MGRASAGLYILSCVNKSTPPSKSVSNLDFLLYNVCASDFVYLHWKASCIVEKDLGGLVLAEVFFSYTVLRHKAVWPHCTNCFLGRSSTCSELV